MDATLWVGVVWGAGSFGLVAMGTGCAASPANCPVNEAVVLPLGLIGAATLLPLGYCYSAYRRDRAASSNEGTSLLAKETLVDADGYPVQSRIRAYLYASHFLSAWGDRMWQFAVPLLFMEIFVDTLLPSALFSLVRFTPVLFTTIGVAYIVGVAAVPSLGQWLDRSNRMRVLSISIAVENACVLVSTVALGLILTVLAHAPTAQWTWTGPLSALFGVTLVAGAVGSVFGDAQTLSIEKDWVVVLAAETRSALGGWNTAMRRIDLSCALLAPASFGVIVDFAGTDPMTRAAVGAAAVGGWNLLSAPLEYAMARDVYAFVPALRGGNCTVQPKATLSAGAYVRMWAAYARHPTFLVSFAFCALYMTVLSGGGLNTAYLQWRGLPLSLLGASSGLGALFGLVGTLLFPQLVACCGRVERVAVLSVWLFWLTLLPIGGCFVLLGETRTTDYVMMGAVLLSRMWLWSCDLAETQIMQEWVEPDRRGTINAMQSATSKLFYIGVLLVGVAFADPREFETLVFVSLAAVGSAAVGFAVWYSTHGSTRHL
ncbi:Ferroportin (FP) Family [Achlya hypogyna]|uniref:Solute carrier family 40 member n=1 Tax=Achlya hypogyna TaxID=1202772 RepID=A0A1V9Z9M1_ACHHY|nr:Ferroportin (FP) Family [Achlya hypogyna]